MAKLTLRVDAQTIGEETIPDAKLLSQVDLFVAALGGPVGGTGVEKLGFAALRLRGYLLEVAKGEKRRLRQAEADALAATDNAALEG